MTTRDHARRRAASDRPRSAAAGSGGATPTRRGPCIDRPALPETPATRPASGRASTCTGPSATPRSGRATSRPSSAATTRELPGRRLHQGLPAQLRAVPGPRPGGGPRSSGGASAATRRSAKPVHRRVPQPIAAPRQGLTFSPGIVVAALLTIVVARVRGATLGVQLMRFAKPPTIAVTDPRDAVRRSTTRTRPRTRSRARRCPGATVSVDDRPADHASRSRPMSTGTWTPTSTLRRGRNEFRSTRPTRTRASTPSDTVDASSSPCRSSTIEAPTLTVDQPAEGATFENGAIPVQGTATNATSVDGHRGLRRAGRRRRGEPEVERARRPAPAARPPITVAGRRRRHVDTGDSPLELTTGRWSITIDRVERRGQDDVADPPRRRSPTRASTSSWRSRAARPGSRSGSTARSTRPSGAAAGRIPRRQGPDVHRQGRRSRSGPARRARPTSRLNGQSLGALGKRGIPETWLFAAARRAGPTQTSRPRGRDDPDRSDAALRRGDEASSRSPAAPGGRAWPPASTVATAESCTGGLVAAAITDDPGLQRLLPRRRRVLRRRARSATCSACPRPPSPPTAR